MDSLRYCFGLLLVALVCVKNSNSISCYECNSAQDKRCLGDQNNKLSDDLKEALSKQERQGLHPLQEDQAGHRFRSQRTN
ncbi:hypothetical protein NQ318_002135 [Aromia moschata]|uniref:Uncharacterized protein n=1 Tax=Aromia moschata TaxID=1265417 RepID=A0AAV8Y0K0_9CUCU|nr:hypothetical protein NQ318_002135 [Aromia moschata]